MMSVGDIVVRSTGARRQSARSTRTSSTLTPRQDCLQRGAQHIIDRHFTHLSPGKVPEINGTLDLETERALSSADDPLLDLITGGRFPSYAYANIDVLHACRRLAGGSSRARRLVHQDAPASPRAQHPAHLEV